MFIYRRRHIKREKKVYISKDLHPTTSPVAYPHLCYSSKTNEALGAKKKMKEKKETIFSGLRVKYAPGKGALIN